MFGLHSSIKFLSSVLFSTFILSFSVANYSCKYDPVSPQSRLILSAVDASCTEVWLKLNVENISLPVELNLIIDSTSSKLFHLVNSTDTILYIDTLLLNKDYSFQLVSTKGIKSNIAEIKTLDTSTHNYTWQTYELGDGFGSDIYDAFIFDENKIYAVGEMYLRDSTGQIDSYPYGLATWDGNSWNISLLEILSYDSLHISPLAPNAILAFSESDIWYVSGGVHHWNGTKLKSYFLYRVTGSLNPIFNDDQRIIDIWGNNNTNLYVSGMKGALGYFDGNNWVKLESNTNGDMFDIYAIKNINNEKYEIYCPVAYIDNLNGEFIRISENNHIENIDFGLGRITSIWGLSNNKIYASWRSIFVGSTTGWKKIEFDDYYSKRRIRGNGLNNIFVVGGLGFVGHFNGISWKNYPELLLDGGNYNNVILSENTVVICGYNNGRGIVVIGKRNL